MIGYVILGLVAAFFAVILIRAALFTPKPQKGIETEGISFDKDRAVETLQALVRCKTVSYNDPQLEDDAEFEKLVAMLPDLYPIDYSGNVDFNGDGMIDIRDAQRLFQYSMLPDLYPIS